MAPRVAAARSYLAVAGGNEGERAALADALADDVEIKSPFGQTVGRDAALGAMPHPLVAAFLGAAQASDPEDDGTNVTVRAVTPPTMPVGGFAFAFAFDATDRITRVEIDMLPPGPLEPSPVHLDDAVKDAINGAVRTGHAMILTYVDAEGQPQMSLRGTTQAYSDDQLAVWVRDPRGGLTRAIEHNARVALMYHDPETHQTYQFHGRARLVDTDDVRAQVYGNAFEGEQNMDWRRRGAPVIVDLDRVEGIGPGGRILMQRGG
jgi:pyridoxamine 5'-phosphate oxidase-like protein